MGIAAPNYVMENAIKRETKKRNWEAVRMLFWAFGIALEDWEEKQNASRS